jgi:hypothetical protein
MGYREDPEARDALKTAYTGLGIALAFLLVLGAITFAWAGGMSGGGEHAEGGAAPAAAQH